MSDSFGPSDYNRINSGKDLPEFREMPAYPMPNLAQNESIMPIRHSDSPSGQSGIL